MPDFEVQNAESQRYGLHIKKDTQLEDLKKLYSEKIGELQNTADSFQNAITDGTNTDKILKIVEIFGLDFCLNKQLSELENSVINKLNPLSNKILRLVDKNRCTLQEIDLREQELVVREPVGTIYYIDLDNGDDGNDGLTFGNAWKTIEKYTTVESRSPGDIAKVRAGTSEIPAGIIEFDEDGTKDSLILIKGCDSVDDPWGDASDVRPIINYNGNNYYCSTNLDQFWKFQNIDFRNGSIQVFSTYDTYNIFWDNCRFYDSGANGINIGQGGYGEFENCIFFDNTTKSLNISSGVGRAPLLRGCEFNGGTGGTSYGIYVANNGDLFLENCKFGQTTAHGSADIYVYRPIDIYMKNCKYNTITYYVGYALNRWKRECLEDDDEVFEAHKVNTWKGTLERDTSVVRSGGADSSLKMTPSSGVGLYEKFNSSGCRGELLTRGIFKVWLETGVEKTITVYIKGFGWTGFPTAPQLFLRASYYGSGANCIRNEIDSDEVLTDNVTWEPFQVTLTPSRTGFVYLDVFLGKYEANSGINIDIEKPI